MQKSLKKILAVLFAIALFVAVIPAGMLSVGAATSGTTGSCTWEIENGTELIVSGNGPMEDYYSCGPWGESITKVTICDGVTSIGAYAFYDCEALTSITLGNGVTSIGNSSFSGCETLTSITFGNGLTSIGKSAFYKCSGFKSLTIGNSVKSIGDSAFQNCTGLTNIKIPNSVTSIGMGTFGYCSRLTSIEIPDSVTSISNSAFNWCTGLKTATIGNSVKSIDNNTFKGCSALTTVTLGNSIKSIGNNAFDGCWALTSITIPNDVISIGASAFCECSKLTSITIPNSVKSIGNNAFYYCSALTTVTIGNSVISIGSGAFSKCSIKDVYFNGTESEFNNWSQKSVFDGARIHFIEIKDLIKINNISLGLADNIVIYCYLEKDAADENLKDFYLKATFDQEKYTIKDYEQKGDYYVFAFKNISPDKMTDKLSVSVCGKSGTSDFLGDTSEFSVEDYCLQVLEEYSYDKELRTLVVDLLNYGAEAQLYKNRKTDTLPTRKLTFIEKSWGTAATPQMQSCLDKNYEQIANETFMFKGANLNLNNAITTQLYFETSDISGVTVKVKDKSGNVISVIDSSEFIKDQNGYMLRYRNMDVSKMRDEVYFTAYKNGQEISNTLRYSVESYCARMKGTDIENLLTAMLKYGDSAKIYVER